MKRRGVVIGTLAVATAGCVDRIHDVAASTPRDIDVRSRYFETDPLVESESIVSAPMDVETHARAYTGAETATDAMVDDAEAAREFVTETAFVDDGGDAVLLVAQRLAPPSVDFRLASVSRTGEHALRISASEVGTRHEEDPVAHTLFIRLADERGPPERVTVSVSGDRASVTV
ncbi:hypothetical protein [Halorubrum vacuolatum]|uniref:Uncharacterized protein n=1 Tax=Halorubrum vacuolatum TaxID=63740 RepID=A0A238XWT8_HALVU|nr:hypothetical protein [Halorubrum vacuolatum]SNR62903.1 hypothetical protein SAMN06264855_12414 [Halorubrum vacuolatum]